MEDAPLIARISIEPSRRCSKGCAFCYNGSSPDGLAGWDADELVAFVRDCAAHGVAVCSFGGGEPLEYEPIFAVLRALEGVLARTLTTSGLPLEERATFDALVAARPDKVHVSVHAPENPREIERAIRFVHALDAAGIAAGVNLLVRRSRLPEAKRAFDALSAAGIGAPYIVLLPMRGDGHETPSPAEVAEVAGRGPFQSMRCLSTCGKSPRFASIGADRTVAWCSYTRTRRPLRAGTFAALGEALDGLGLEPCANGLVRLGVRRNVS